MRTFFRQRARLRLLVVLVLLGSLAGNLAFLHGRAVRLVQPVRTQPLSTPDDFGITAWEEVSFTAVDGIQLSGWFIPPSPDSDGTTLIFVHGLGSNRGALLDQAAMLAKHGYGALLFDLRAHGRSQGERTSWGLVETADVAAAVAFLQSQPDVNPDRLALVGHSMGGAIAIRAAAQLPAIQAVIVESSYATFAENADRLTVSFARLPAYLSPVILPWAEWLAGVDAAEIRPVDQVGELSPRPVLFIHGEQDRTIEVSNSQRLYAAALAPKALYLVADAGHEDLLAADPAAFEQRIITFLCTAFPGH